MSSSSTPAAAAAAATAAPPPVDTRLTFPPFPTPPAGTTIIPFSAFKERGIQMFPSSNDTRTKKVIDQKDGDVDVDVGDDDDDVGIELDGLGIPTVELRAKHDMDECKTDTRRKRRRLNAKAKKKTAARRTAGAGEAPTRREWWEIWEENEDLKGGGPYDPRVPALDRLYESAVDFRKSRTWPPNPTGISASWDQFRLFVGLLSNTPVWTRTDKAAQEGGGGDEDGGESSSSEDEETTASVSNAPAAPPRPNPRPLPRTPYALYGTDPIPVSSDDQVQSLLNTETARREAQMLTFLNSPYPLLQTFLSSYMRKQGLIWADKNLINIPRLIGFYIRFLIRNEVFRGEKAIERELKRSVGLIETAEKELILTSKIAKQIPDDASRAFRMCWGPKAEGYRPLPDEGNDDTNDKDDMAVEEDIPLFKDMEEIKVTDDLLNDTAKLEALRDNLDPNINTLPPTTTTTGDDGGNTWGTAATDGDGTWGATDSSMTDWGAPAAADWGPPQLFTLFPFLGPTTLPISHTTGIVENSVRRIKSVHPPTIAPAAAAATATTNETSADGDQWSADAEKIEADLDTRFAKIVLEPWLNWDSAKDAPDDGVGDPDDPDTKAATAAAAEPGETPYMDHPRILPDTSRGEVRGVVLAPDGSATRATAAATTSDVGGTNDNTNANANDGGEKDSGDKQPPPLPDVTVPAHDPLSDTITLLVEPSVLPDMVPGMGLGGTWVQIARSAEYARQINAGAGAGKKKKGKGKKKATGAIGDGKFWYVDELMLVLTSYHR